MKFSSLTLSLGLGAFFCVLAGCGSAPAQQAGGERIAVTTSWLECCVRDVAGDGVEIVRLAPPGQCPGHFDFNPGDLKKLLSSSALFRFDFQSSLDQKLSGGRANVPIMPITAPPGLCVPDGYRRACQAVAQSLIHAQPARRELYQGALDRTSARLASLEQEIQAKVDSAGLRGALVVASGHQAAFCRWLGLEPVAVFSGGDQTTPAALEELIRQGRDSSVRYVIANLQEGRQMGEALGRHLGAPLVTFSNFPSMNPDQNSFDALVRANVDALLAASAKP